jgi:hypothetical protein
MGFRTEKFGPPSPNTPDFPYPKGSPGGNDTHETCMNELEKCMNFPKNLDFTLPTSIEGFQGPNSTVACCRYLALSRKSTLLFSCRGIQRDPEQD